VGMERVAQCHCGQLRAIATGEPGSVYLCHCKACQRRSGSVAHWGTRWQKSQVRLEGPRKVYARKADSGFEIRCHFCPNCGTTVFAEGDRTPEFCVVPAGCFGDLGLPPPTISVWEESRHSWLGVASVSEHHPRSLPVAAAVSVERG
jgi:hypothetical protein